MIAYELYCQIRLLHQERGLNFAQIARELNLDEETVAKWARAKSYTQRSSNTRRKSKLEPYKVIIQRWLERHSYTATQIFQRLQAEEGYSGGLTIVTDYVRTIRRVPSPAFLTLAFAPGECAQVDWGCAGSDGRQRQSHLQKISHSIGCRRDFFARTCLKKREKVCQPLGSHASGNHRNAPHQRND